MIELQYLSEEMVRYYQQSKQQQKEFDWQYGKPPFSEDQFEVPKGQYRGVRSLVIILVVEVLRRMCQDSIRITSVGPPHSIHSSIPGNLPLIIHRIWNKISSGSNIGNARASEDFLFFFFSFFIFQERISMCSFCACPSTSSLDPSGDMEFPSVCCEYIVE